MKYKSLTIVVLLEPEPSNQRLADAKVIPVAIVGCYVGLAWEVGVAHAGVTSVDNLMRLLGGHYIMREAQG